MNLGAYIRHNPGTLDSGLTLTALLKPVYGTQIPGTMEEEKLPSGEKQECKKKTDILTYSGMALNFKQNTVG